MYIYNIRKDGFVIGQAHGKHKAFEFIQKEIDRNGNIGYWKGDQYLSEGKLMYTIERSIE